MFRTGHKNDPLPEPERGTAVSQPTERPTVAPDPVAVAAPPAPPVPAKQTRDATIGRGVTFDGTLRFTGTLTIDGTFKGHILNGDTLVIGTGAKVTAEVSCGAIEVFGEVQGSLTGTRAVELRSAARVSADVTTPSLRIADGAVLDGTVRMSGTPNVSRKHSERVKRSAPVPDENAIPVG